MAWINGLERKRFNEEQKRLAEQYLDEDEAQLRALTDSALQKLSEITDEDFAELELIPDFDTDE